MGIAPIGQHLTRGPLVDGKKPQVHRDAGQILQHVVQQLGLNVLQHIDATHQISRLGLAIGGEGRIIGVVLQLIDARLRQTLEQVFLARPIAR
jgi:hypothetical protein